MGKPLDLSGQRFGRLVVICKSNLRSGDGSVKWECKCECGQITAVASSNLRNGHIVSCGCLNAERFHGTVTHGALRGGNKPPEYRVWSTMKERCANPANHKFPDYGGRGITVCRRWAKSFAAFVADMGPRPSARHSIERIDNNKGYSPDNCRWATALEQAANRRLRSNSRFVVLDGVRKTVTQWAVETGINRNLIYSRLNRGWNPRKALRAS